MHSNFFELFSLISENFPLTLDLHYSKITDWVVDVRKRGCASDYPKSLRDGDDALLFHLQHCDRERLFKTARNLLIRWMERNVPGYVVTDFCENCYWFWMRHADGTGLCMNPDREKPTGELRIPNTNTCSQYLKPDKTGRNDMVYGIRSNIVKK